MGQQLFEDTVAPLWTEEVGGMKVRNYRWMKANFNDVWNKVVAGELPSGNPWIHSEQGQENMRRLSMWAKLEGLM